MVAVKWLIDRANEELDKAGIDDPAFNTLCIAEKVFGVSRSDLIAGNPTAEDKDGARFVALLGRRLSGEPLQYVLGEWDFYGYKFSVGPGVLIPRDDTEVLLRDCLAFLKGRKKPGVLDLCSGSGALAVAIGKETGAEVTAVEKSFRALPYLSRNIRQNHSSVIMKQGDIFTCASDFPDSHFDLILSNPPYVKSSEIDSLQREISYEPRMALDGGEDGLIFYRAIVKDFTSKLKPGGMLAFELGEGQFEVVKDLMIAAGFENISGSLDLGGIQRSIYGTLLRN